MSGEPAKVAQGRIEATERRQQQDAEEARDRAELQDSLASDPHGYERYL